MGKIHKPSRQKVKVAAIDILIIVSACAVGAFSLEAVMLPNGLTSGGLTGVVRIVQTFIKLDFSILYYAGSLVIIILVWIFLGLRELRKLLFLTILYPAVIFVFEQFHFELLEEHDVILAAIFCGVFGGICSGLVFWRGYSFCGTDAIAKIVKKRLLPHAPISKILLAIDATVIIASAFIFGRNIALYALVTQVIMAKTIDYVMFGFETKIVKLEIITDNKDIISDYIIEEVRRGVSCSEIVGEFTGRIHNKLEVLCSPRESVLIRRFIAQNDQEAFITGIHVDTVWGSGTGFADITKE